MSRPITPQLSIQKDSPAAMIDPAASAEHERLPWSPVMESSDTVSQLPQNTGLIMCRCYLIVLHYIHINNMQSF